MTTVEEVLVGVAAGGGGVLGVSILVYAVGSYALMHRYNARRSFWRAVRSLASEIWLAVVTQPFLPLYYFVGRRMEPFFAGRASAAFPEGTARVPVVFVHGYMQNRIGFVALARALTRRGIGPLYGVNYPWFASIEANAKRLERFVTRVCTETKAAEVDLVCHSMGGLVAVEMMRSLGAEGKPVPVRRCVTIASPHAGVRWRGPIFGIGGTALRAGSELLTSQAGYMLSVPTLSVFSTHDNIVYPKESSQLSKRGGRDVEVEGYGHLAILFSPAVADAVSSFLLEPTAPKAIVAANDAAG